jgi:carboxypeptidase Q
MAILSPDLDGTNYFDVHHTANDTMAQIDPGALRQSTAAYAMCAWLAAQYSGDWQRVDTEKPPSR